MLLFAHRGVSGYHVDNSIPAFKHAVDLNLPIELDVQMSQDGILYVYHDYIIKELDGLLIEFDSEKINQVRIEGERIPTLKEVLQLIPNDILINVEVKQMGLDQRDMTQDLYEMMKGCHNLDNIIVSSFNHHVLCKIRQLDNQLKLGMLFDQVVKDFPDYIHRSGISPFSIHMGLEVVSKGLVEQLHTLDLPVYVYTVNSKSSLNRVKVMGVDGIFTNYPDKMVD